MQALPRYCQKNLHREAYVPSLFLMGDLSQKWYQVPRPLQPTPSQVPVPQQPCFSLHSDL